MLEQEIYEQFISQGMDEYSADLLAHEQATDLETHPLNDHTT